MVSQELPYDDADDTGATLLAFLQDHQTEGKTEVVAQGVVVLLWSVLASLLYRFLRAGERSGSVGWSTVALAGSLGIVALVGVAVAIQRALVLGSTDEDAAAGAYILAQHLSEGLFTVAAGMTGIFLLGVGMAALQTRLIWTWLAWVALVAAAACVAGALLGLVGDNEEGVAGLLTFVGQIGWLLVVLGLGIKLLRRPRDVMPAAAQEAASRSTS